MKYQVYAKNKNGEYEPDMLLDNEEDAAERAKELCCYDGIYEEVEEQEES